MIHRQSPLIDSIAPTRDATSAFSFRACPYHSHSPDYLLPSHRSRLTDALVTSPSLIISGCMSCCFYHYTSDPRSGLPPRAADVSPTRGHNRPYGRRAEKRRGRRWVQSVVIWLLGLVSRRGTMARISCMRDDDRVAGARGLMLRQYTTSMRVWVRSSVARVG